MYPKKGYPCNARKGVTLISAEIKKRLSKDFIKDASKGNREESSGGITTKYSHKATSNSDA